MHALPRRRCPRGGQGTAAKFVACMVHRAVSRVLWENSVIADADTVALVFNEVFDVQRRVGEDGRQGLIWCYSVSL